MNEWGKVGSLYSVLLGAMAVMFLLWVPVSSMFKRKIYRSGKQRKIHGVVGWGCAGILSTFAWFSLVVIVCLSLFVAAGGFK